MTIWERHLSSKDYWLNPKFSISFMPVCSKAKSTPLDLVCWNTSWLYQKFQIIKKLVVFSYMFDEDALPHLFLFCVCLVLSRGRRHSQNHGCADLHLNVEKVVPDVFEIHVLWNRVKTCKICAFNQKTDKC